MQHEHDEEPRPRLDRDAALEQLERFGRDIQRYRAQREAVGDEFETFVRSFKNLEDASAAAERPRTPVPPPPVVIAALVGEPPVPAPPVMTATPVANEDVPSIFETPATEVSPPAMAAPPPLEAPVARGRSSASMAPLTTAAVALLLGGGLLAVVLWNRSPAPATTTSPETSAPAAQAPPAAADQPAATAAAAAATPPAPAVRSTDSEIVTARTVWIRVVADGAKVLEREVPAGTRIPIKAEKTIVIRTGDAGAVRLTLRGGEPRVLGREGEVVTRAFTVPPPAASGAR